MIIRREGPSDAASIRALTFFQARALTSYDGRRGVFTYAEPFDRL